jgi:hypothetical protein
VLNVRHRTQPLTTSNLLDELWSAGAIKATGNRGLQPAMDHILEHEGDPVPDLANTATGSAAPAAAHGFTPQDAMDVEDDEDAEALRAALKMSAGGGGEGEGAGAPPADDADAKVREIIRVWFEV